MDDVADAKDNVLLMKLTQASVANDKRSREVEYWVGDKVLPSTFHRCHKYKQKGDRHAAKAFPRWDGPYTVIEAHPKILSYKLNNNDSYPYYTSQLKPYQANNPTLFPNYKLPKPGPVLTPEGLQEHMIELS